MFQDFLDLFSRRGRVSGIILEKIENGYSDFANDVIPLLIEEDFSVYGYKMNKKVLPIDTPDMQVITTRIPIGVIAAIIPWNSQMLLTAVKLAPALAMGNTVVIKSSELAPATMFEFAKLIEKTGIPKGVVNVISGFGDPCGKALTSHPLVEKIAFTAGPETARYIIKNSAENLSQVSL